MAITGEPKKAQTPKKRKNRAMHFETPEPVTPRQRKAAKAGGKVARKVIQAAAPTARQRRQTAAVAARRAGSTRSSSGY